MKIIDRIFDELDKKGLKQARLAEAIGISTGQLSNWKRRGTDPRAIYIKPIAEFLGVSENYLLTGVNESAESELDTELSAIDYALFGETKHLNDSEKQELLRLAKFFREQKEKKGK